MQKIDWDGDGLGRPDEKGVGSAQGSVHVVMQAVLNAPKMGCSSHQYFLQVMFPVESVLWLTAPRDYCYYYYLTWQIDGEK